MRYAGGKHRISRKLIAYMQPDIDKAKHYIEPFLGGANILCNVQHDNRIAADNNHYIIAMWQAAVNGWLPDREITKELYNEIKSNPQNFPPELVGFCGVGMSFAGTWFGSYAADKRGYDYQSGAERNLIRQSALMQGVEFMACSYDKLLIPAGSVIYCDPPYSGVGQRYITTKFDSNAFFEWCREQTRSGNKVYISEYNAPPDFEIAAEFEHATTMRPTNKPKPTIEKLFTYGG